MMVKALDAGGKQRMIWASGGKGKQSNAQDAFARHAQRAWPLHREGAPSLNPSPTAEQKVSADDQRPASRQAGQGRCDRDDEGVGPVP
jgi:hypothetical protein